MGVGVRSLVGLRDVRNPSKARLQNRGDTCGLYAVASVLDGINPGSASLDLSGVRGQVRANRIAGLGDGLNSYELMTLIERSLPDEVVVLIERGVTEDRLLDLLGQGHVISHVDGNHWVRVLGPIADGGSIWARIYDPARGNYEQRLSSFMTRAGQGNQMLWIRS